MTTSAKNPLAKFSTKELLAEIARRKASPGKRRGRTFRNCDECRHFRKADVPLALVDTHNPCGLGHRTSFKVPETGDPYLEEWGYYRRGCGDYDPAPAK